MMLDIHTEAELFRKATDEAKWNIPTKYRMHGFPRGCCDDATDLFAHYLNQKYGIQTTRVDGEYYTDHIEERDWHTWLEVDGLIVDLTADQYPEYYKRIYVGSYDDFHNRYEMKRQTYRGFLDLGPDCWSWMQEIYDLIHEELMKDENG